VKYHDIGKRVQLPENTVENWPEQYGTIIDQDGEMLIIQLDSKYYEAETEYGFDDGIRETHISDVEVLE